MHNTTTLLRISFYRPISEVTKINQNKNALHFHHLRAVVNFDVSFFCTQKMANPPYFWLTGALCNKKYQAPWQPHFRSVLGMLQEAMGKRKPSQFITPVVVVCEGKKQIDVPPFWKGMLRNFKPRHFKGDKLSCITMATPTMTITRFA